MDPDLSHLRCEKARQIYGLLAHLIPQTAGLPVTALTTEQRKVLGGHLFAEGAELVEGVGKILTQFADLFPHIPIKGPDLLAAQERADAWKMVCSHLQVLLRLATDSYLHEQGTAISQALLVVRQVDGEAALPLTTDGQAELRQVALWWPREILARRRAHARKLARTTRLLRRITQVADGGAGPGVDSS